MYPMARRERFSPMVLPKAAEAKQGGLPGDEVSDAVRSIE